MKKLIAMIGAVAMSFGLFAALPGANSFEAGDPGVTQGATTFDWSDSRAVDQGWSAWTDAVINLGIYDGDAYEYTKTNRRDDDFNIKGEDCNLQYLKLETGKESLKKDFADGDIFLDQLVKFTGFEEDQVFEAEDGTKIALWMRSDEGDDAAADPETTNKLYITAGKMVAGEVSPITLQIGADNEFEPNEWYRLTIKFVGNIFKDDTGATGIAARGGFIVYIDGDQVTLDNADAKSIIDAGGKAVMTEKAAAFMDKGQLFPSMTASIELDQVAFQGIGAIDDMITDANGPDFAQTIDIAPLPPEDTEIAKVMVGDVEIPCLDGSYTVAKGVTVRVYLKGVGSMYPDPEFKDFANVTGDTKFDFSDIEVKSYAASVAFEDEVTYCKTVEETIAKVQELAVGEHDDITVTVLDECASEDGSLEFTADTEITISAGGIWAFDLADGEMVCDAVIADEKTVTVENGALTLSGAIAAGSSITADAVTLGDALSVAGDFAAAEITLDGNKMTLVGNGAVVSGTQIGKEAFENPADDVVEKQVGDNWVYTLQQFVPVCEINGKKYATLAEAVGEAQATDTIKILVDIALDDWVLIEKTVTIDLNGCKLEPSANWPTVSPAHDAILAVKHGGNLTITDSLTGGTIDGSSLYAAVKMTIAGDEVDTYTDANKAVLVVNGGHLIGNYAGITGNGSAKRGNCDVTVNGGLIEGTALNDNAGIFFPCYGNLTINGGTVQGAMGVYLKAGRGEVAVGSAAQIIANGAKGAFVAKGDGFENTGDAFVVDNAGYIGGVPDPVIAAGTFISANGAAVASYAQGTLEPVVGFVTGGTFTGQVKIDDAIAGGNWAFGPFVAGQPQSPVPAVAKIGTVNYASLAAAVAAAADDDTVTLIANTTLDATLTVDKALAFNLNGKTVTFANTLTKGIDAAEAGELVISNGTITVADGRANIAYSRAIYLLHTSGVFKDLVINVPGFEYALNKDCDTEPDSDCWKKPLDYTLDCENVAINGNGSLFHIENAEATLKDCVTTVNTALPSFGGAHEAAIYSSCGAVTTVDGGIFTAPNALQTGNYGGDIIVKDGEFNGNIKSWMLDEDTRDFADVNKANITIEGGKFTGNFVYAANCSAESPLLTVEISGGDFSDKTIPTAFIKPEEHKVAKWVDSKIPDYVTPGYDDETFDITFTDAAEWTNVVKTVYNQTPVAPKAPTKEGYEFKGWDKEIVPATEATTYTAQYTANSYYVQTYTNEFAYIQEAYTFGDEAITLTAPVLAENEEWDGKWYTDNTYATEWSFDGSVADNTQKAYAKITVKQDEPKVDPEQPIPVPTGKTAEQVAEEMNTKGIENYLNIPTVVTDEGAYTAMFEAKADGKGAVIIDLKSDVEKEIADQLANEETSGSMLNPDATTSEVTITAKPGLYYGIKAVGDVTTIGTAPGENWVQATGNSVNVVRPTVEGNAAFFQAVCTPKNPQSNAGN